MILSGLQSPCGRKPVRVRVQGFVHASNEAVAQSKGVEIQIEERNLF